MKDMISNFEMNNDSGNPVLSEGNLLMSSGKHIPGSVSYSIRRFIKPAQTLFEEGGSIHYSVSDSPAINNSLDLKFCITGNMYCEHGTDSCNQCRFADNINAAEHHETIDILNFRFSDNYIRQFASSSAAPRIVEKQNAFPFASSFKRDIPVCGKTRTAIDALLNHNYSGTSENIFVNAQTQILLLYSMECFSNSTAEENFTCRFLANEADREKIINARSILLQHIGDPITIRALSRKAGINECYLKKGFKEIFGTTIFDFYQSQRMEHAKYLLYEKGLSVTDVSDLLGYSSISHFSTAFKKQTGIKPCELLFRP